MRKHYIWGVQRLGYLLERRYLGRRCSRLPCGVGPPVQCILGLPPGIGRPSVVADSVVELLRGSRRYELSDWLGNVRVVVTDERVPIRWRGVVIGYRAEVVSVGDYYSFGAEIRERSYEVALGYRWGYQAQEKDNELYGRGASYYYRYRQQDARLGRFWSVDPLAGKYPWNSPYAFAENRLVDGVEWEGLELKLSTTQTQGPDGTTIHTNVYTLYVRIPKPGGAPKDRRMDQQYSNPYLLGIGAAEHGQSLYNEVGKFLGKVMSGSGGEDDPKVEFKIVEDDKATITFVPLAGAVDYRIDEEGEEHEVFGRVYKVGDPLVNRIWLWTDGRDREAVVRSFAHEIGHIGGLRHPPIKSGNLMDTGIPDSKRAEQVRLDSAQKKLFHQTVEKAWANPQKANQVIEDALKLQKKVIE